MPPVTRAAARRARAAAALNEMNQAGDPVDNPPAPVRQAAAIDQHYDSDDSMVSIMTLDTEEESEPSDHDEREQLANDAAHQVIQQNSDDEDDHGPDDGHHAPPRSPEVVELSSDEEDSDPPSDNDGNQMDEDMDEGNQVDEDMDDEGPVVFVYNDQALDLRMPQQNMPAPNRAIRAVAIDEAGNILPRRSPEPIILTDDDDDDEGSDEIGRAHV